MKATTRYLPGKSLIRGLGDHTVVMRRAKGIRRSRLQAAADLSTIALNQRLGRALRNARQTQDLTQMQAATIAGISRTEWSGLELGQRDATLWIVNRAAAAVGSGLRAYLEGTSAADRPRDAVQLKAQELVIATARAGGWHGLPEQQIDGEARTSRFADVILQRPRHQPTEVALIEIIDWFDDVGAPMRDWPRRLEAVERQAIGRMVGDQSVPRVSGCWILRATHRNRELIGAHANLFRNRFPGSGRAWLAAFGTAGVAMPKDAALLWVSVDGSRMFAVRWR